MQASGPPRLMQRRSPGAEPGPPPNIPVRSISPAPNTIQPRGSGASSRSSQGGPGARRPNQPPNSSVPLSQIEKSVTHLLVATKQLLETLTQWSRGQATDGQVSDVYVRLGYEFNMACRAFTAINVDTSDLGNVPELLRHILEATLSQEANSESLEKYLPRIRDIIINLLHGLKRKQQKLRQKTARDRESGSTGSAGSLPERTTSTNTISSVGSGLTTMLDDGIKNDYRDSQNAPAKNRFPPQRDDTRSSTNSGMSSISSNTMQSMPVQPPYPENGGIPTSAAAPGEFSIDNFPPPPPTPPSPPPKQSSGQRALAALQKGGELERRASRRYSQFQLARHLGAPAVPLLPTGNLPIPNRERGELKESLRAVQVRETPPRHKRDMSSQSRITNADSSPMRPPNPGSEDVTPPAELPAPVVDQATSPEDYKPSATLQGPMVDSLPMMVVDSAQEEKPFAPSLGTQDSAPRPQTPPVAAQPDSFFQESPVSPTKELTLFLQYKSKVKKYVLPGGMSELSIGRLQLAFIEKFSWNTQQNGVDLPDIYIQDPVSGVRHELEDLSDIKDRTVLVLNIEPLDEVKKHIDDGLGSLRQLVQEVKQNVDDQNVAITRVSDRQQETAQEVARLASAPAVAMSPPADGSRPRMAGKKLDGSHLKELQSIRRDLAVVRQTFSNFQAEVQGAMSTIRTKAANVKVAAASASIPAAEGAEGYSYVQSGRKELNANSDRIVAKVDDLQDLVEDLRKDVVHRGVRPLPRQLETVNKDIVMLSKELKKMEDYMNREKPIWTKIWEKELEDVCQGRDELRLMEDLMVDLRDDLEKAAETFSLVEQATKEQMKDNGTSASAGTARNFSSKLDMIGSADPSVAKEGVLGEVRALRPNHENRLEAIERAEKLRQKELESRKGGALQKELNQFVEEGRLKKSGGFEEVERARKAKDERIRREVWERQNGIVPENPVGEDGGAADAEGAVNGI
ncbi:hypothetical protein jhhlp_005497 [Lomentospora prolificans]|uniref:Actin interacting protein 3 C-terminal domain-containing protein n=1 Tax=Lomentospora prolificans TaxID=41688 RepID=A0A2N3N3B7_9PEZI|nr:hypothetical protein jhhlp_005497 [Lomentospora prolificans]